MKNLIEKYFAGETTLEEEAQLKTWFNSGEVNPDLKQYQPLFRFFKAEQERELADDFDQKVLARLENNGKVVRLWPKRLLQIAAIGILLVAAFIFFQKPITQPQHAAIDWEKYETQDPELAYEQTKEALKLLSSKLKRGTSKTVEEVAKTSKVSKYLDNQ